MKRLRNILAFFPVFAVLPVLTVAACKGDPNKTKLQYVPDMADSPALKSQRDFLQPPEGTVTYVPDREKADFLPPDDAAKLGVKSTGRDRVFYPAWDVRKGHATRYATTSDQSETMLENPLKPSAENSEKGKALWGTFCITCHGADGGGKGSIADVYPLQPANLLSKQYLNRKDGFYFHVITHGIRTMPGYGHAISPEERWLIALYIHDLQKAAQ
jgi:mono/diheme cytochrome c family protein